MQNKRIIVIIGMPIIITIFGYIIPQFNSDFKSIRENIKYIQFFFPSIGFSVWLLFALSLEMAFRLKYNFRNAIIANLSSVKIIKEYKQYLKNNSRKFDWLYITFFTVLLILFILLILLILLQ